MVLSICQLSMIRKIEIIIASPGIIWTTRIARMNVRRPLNRNRVTASDARNPRTMAMTSVKNVTVSEFPIAGMNGARVSSVIAVT